MTAAESDFHYPGPGREIEQERVIAAGDLPVADNMDVTMTHLVSVLFADAKMKGAADKNALVEVNSVTGNVVNIKARALAGAGINLNTISPNEIQVFARGF